MLMLFKSWVVALIATRGYVIRRIALENDEVRPIADHTPWREDPEFCRVFEQIQPATLVDVYRLYELWQLVEQSRKLEGAVLEVGTWRGGSAALIAERCRSLGIDAPIYACDTFRGVVKAGANDPLYRGGEHSDASRKGVQRLLDGLGLAQVQILEGVFPEDTSHAVADERFRLCHIDVDTYTSAREVSDWVWPRLVRGGIVVYDDYGFRSARGVTKLVDEARHLHDRIVVHNLNGHAVVVKIA